jgi:hypothetical protein
MMEHRVSGPEFPDPPSGSEKTVWNYRIFINELFLPPSFWSEKANRKRSRREMSRGIDCFQILRTNRSVDRIYKDLPDSERITQTGLKFHLCKVQRDNFSTQPHSVIVDLGSVYCIFTFMPTKLLYLAGLKVFTWKRTRQWDRMTRSETIANPFHLISGTVGYPEEQCSFRTRITLWIVLVLLVMSSNQLSLLWIESEVI